MRLVSPLFFVNMQVRQDIMLKVTYVAERLEPEPAGKLLPIAELMSPTVPVTLAALSKISCSYSTNLN